MGELLCGLCVAINVVDLLQTERLYESMKYGNHKGKINRPIVNANAAFQLEF